MTDVAVVTATLKSRSKALRLCERWLSRQSIQDFTHIVEMGEEPRALPLCIYQWRSIFENTKNGICKAAASGADLIVVAEDDDWYGPEFLQQVVERALTQSLLSAHPCGVYNVPTRTYRRPRGTGSKLHVSLSRGLCGLAFRREHTDLVTQNLHRLHALPGGVKFNCTQAVGLKGVVPGLTSQHRKKFGNLDPDGTVLREWLGADADVYLGMS